MDRHIRQSRPTAQCLLLGVLLVQALIGGVRSHGRLVEPPGRSTMWRFGYDNPPNYSDNQLFCGGSQVQWGANGGNCGVCGDNFRGPWENEAGGKYANGIIVRKYDAGQTIDVGVHLTANHKGYFEFRLCQNDDTGLRVEQACFDKHLLADVAGKTRFAITMGMEMVKYQLVLPNLECADCVLQWKYNTGNSWGVDPATGSGCVGCGPQEQFYGCADVAIDNAEVKLGDMDQDVEVPSGDVDERKWREMPDPCACDCGQVGAAVDLGYGLVSMVIVAMLTAAAYLSTTH